MSDLGFIRYSAILRNADVVAEIGQRTETSPNNVDLRAIVLSIAAQAQHGDVACVSVNQLTIYYIKRNDIVVAAVPKDGVPPRISVALLREVDTQLKSNTDSLNATSQKALESSYSKINANRDNLTIAHSEMNKVKQLMVENIDRLLERGERVNLLVDRTGEMSNSANLFNRQAAQLKRKMWYQNVKVVVIGLVLVAVSVFAATKAFN